MIVNVLTLNKTLWKGAFREVYLGKKQWAKEQFTIKKIVKKFSANPKAKNT